MLIQATNLKRTFLIAISTATKLKFPVCHSKGSANAPAVKKFPFLGGNLKVASLAKGLGKLLTGF